MSIKKKKLEIPLKAEQTGNYPVESDHPAFAFPSSLCELRRDKSSYGGQFSSLFFVYFVVNSGAPSKLSKANKLKGVCHVNNLSDM